MATIKNRTFCTAKGNEATVWNVKQTGQANGMRALGKTVRTYVEVAGVTIELEPGCSFQAEGAVKRAGL